ncbi:MAG: DMT family transporter [Acidimicrobiia bacterium]|nr:DMT family transporter [Acidimicrobiia bacterium]
MAIFLSLLTAAIFGTGDFCGGLAAKRASVVQVVAGSHLVGLVGVTIAAVLVADELIFEDVALGAAGGAFGGIGVALLYRGLARGPMSVVAPLTAMTSAAIPAGWGLATGDSLTVAAAIGVGLALVAIGLVSSNSDGTATPVTFQVVGEALVAGVGFGAFFILLDATSSASAPWPIVGARLFTSTLLVLFLVAGRRRVFPRATDARRLIVATGVFDTGSNVLFLYATNQGSLTLVAVLSSLYPISTVLLARYFLHEKMSRSQLWGFGAAVAATALIAAG